MSRIVEYGKLAKDFALTRFSSEEDLEIRRKRIADRLGLMHGLPQKIGQILSFKEFDEGDERVFGKLTEGESDMPLEVFKALLKERIGREAFAEFEWFNRNGISASLGQTHEARLRNGDMVAVKQQYPGIGDALSKDLKAFGWLLKPVGALGRSFDIGALRSEVGTMIAAELDYDREAQWLRRFFEKLQKDPIVSVPRVIDELCTSEVLTMTWIEGERHECTRSWSEAARQDAAEALLRFFLKSTCVWGAAHADPHPGNIRFSNTMGRGCVGIVDFGSVKQLSVAFVTAYRSMLEAALGGGLRDLDLWRIFEGLGFDCEKLEPMSWRLNEVAEILFAPFRERGAFSVSDWSLGDRLKGALGEHRMEFRTAAPAELIFWIRAFHGLVRYLGALEAPLDWGAIAGEVLSVPFGKDRIRAVDEGPQSACVVPIVIDGSSRVKLRVEVTRGGETTASLILPGRSVRELEYLVPREALPVLQQRGESLAEIRDRVIASDFQAGSLFEYSEGEKTVRAWLESVG